MWDYRLHTAAQLLQVHQDGKDRKLALLQQAGGWKLQVMTATDAASAKSLGDQGAAYLEEA